MSLIVLLLGGGVMLLVGQSQDILLGLNAAFRNGKYLHPAIFGFAVWLWSYSVWYGARFARLLLRAPQHNGRWFDVLADCLPAASGWGALLAATMALWWAGAEDLAIVSVALIVLPLLFHLFHRHRRGTGRILRWIDLIFVPWAGDAGRAPSGRLRKFALTGIGLMVVAGVAAAFFVDGERFWAVCAILGIYAFAAWRAFKARIEPHDRWVLSLVFIVSGFLHIMIVVNPVGVGQAIGPAAIFLIAIASWVPFGTQLAVWSETYRVPVFTLIAVLAFIFSFWNDNHAIRTMEPLRLTAPRPTIAEAYGAWRAQRNCPTQVPVIVATEGGGIRAAYWTGQVLAELNRHPDFSACLFAISGVSGGSLGAAVYRVLGESGAVTAARVDDVLKHDFLGPAFASMFYPDLLQRILPVPIMPDRAEAMELAWEDAIRDKNGDSLFARRFSDLAGTAEKRGFPLLFLNGAAVHKGGRIVASTAQIESPGGIYQDLLHDFHTEIRISTAVSNSARFPVVSPAGTVRSSVGYSEQVVDGGYYENNGALTVADIIDALPSPANGGPKKIIVLQILNGMDKPVSHMMKAVLQSVRDVESQCGAAEGRESVTPERLDGISASCNVLRERPDRWWRPKRGGELDLALDNAHSTCASRLDGATNARLAAMRDNCRKRDEFVGGYSGEVMAMVNGLMAARSSHGKQADDALRRTRFPVAYTAIDLFETLPAAWMCPGADTAPPLGWVLSQEARGNMRCQARWQTACAVALMAGQDLSGCGWDEARGCTVNRGECIKD